MKVADADLLTDWQRKNKEYKQRHQLNAHRESDTMARLMKFRQHLQAPKPEVKAKPETSPSTEGACAMGGCSLVLYDTPLVLCSCLSCAHQDTLSGMPCLLCGTSEADLCRCAEHS